MITLVKHHSVGESTSKAVTESFETMEKALVKFYQYLSNYAADESVIRADVVLLNDNLIPCKTEHFVREIPAPVVEEEQSEPTDNVIYTDNGRG